jgi:hypothetical protein
MAGLYGGPKPPAKAAAPAKKVAAPAKKGSSVIDNYNYAKTVKQPTPLTKTTNNTTQASQVAAAQKAAAVKAAEAAAAARARGQLPSNTISGSVKAGVTKPGSNAYAYYQAIQPAGDPGTTPGGDYPQTTQYDSGVTSVGQEPTVDPAEVARQAAARAAVDYKVDPEYLAAKGAYDNVYDQLMATITRENTVYDADLVKANENMGWRGKEQGWDFQNGDTAAGRGMKNLTDDYAARGMLRGSGFGEAQASFRTSLQKQLDQLTAQQEEYKGAQTEKLTQADTSRNQSVNMAAAQALARLTQLYTGA